MDKWIGYGRHRMSLRIRYRVWFAVLIVACPLAANAAPPASKSVASPASSTTAMYPKPSPDAVLLSALRRKIAIKQAQADQLKVDTEINELKTALGQTPSGGAGLPQLIGIYGADGVLTAEFLVGASVMTASAGDWVNAQWRLSSIMRNGVKLRSRSGKHKMLLFGRGGNPKGSSAGGRAFPSASAGVRRAGG